MKNKKIKDALMKRAIGYEAFDVAFEYAADENENMKLCKKKVTKKHISPDILAAKTLLDFFNKPADNPFAGMTDEELEFEKQKLFKQIQNS